ncbi:hypothetical protein TNCV_2156751 [Trichonephila clavipes]|nr:hypothetical protein TNCV_2156751 [Trichonephila clavipes]
MVQVFLQSQIVALPTLNSVANFVAPSPLSKRFRTSSLSLRPGGQSIGLQTGRPGFDALPANTLRVHTEDVLVKSVGPKALWAAAEETMGGGEYLPPL